jgi:aldehyde dehydrogenase family 7 member A1
MRFVPVTKSLTCEVAGKILPALGISANTPNKGVYDGSWFGSGEIITSVDPATNQPIASIQTVFPHP